MLDRRAEIKKDRDSHQRWISSLSGMLRDFGVVFIRRPNFAPGEVLQILRKEKPKPEWFLTDGIRVGAETREGRMPLLDSGVMYKVTVHDERALFRGETLNQMLGDFVHAAECGCSGCYKRVFERWEAYQARIKEESARE